MTMLHVERLGGLAGFGGPRARIRSCGCIELADLPDAARASVEALFRKPPPKRRSASTAADGFRYRLRCEIDGEERSIEVVETAVPAAVSACVHDELI